MALTYLADRRLDGPNPVEVITITIGGRTFRAGRRTAAHLQVTFERFSEEFPDLELEVAQPCYHVGYEPSAGTHDGDGVPDFYVVRNGSILASTEADYWAVQRFLRRFGWAVWFRHTGTWAARSAWHLHAVSLGCPGPVGIFVPGQVDDYYRHALGLKGQHDSGDDPSWFPSDINATVFDYAEWSDTLNADDKQWLENLIDAKLKANNTTLVKAIWDSAVDKAQTTARAALRKASGK